jgi:hypothetical protein
MNLLILTGIFVIMLVLLLRPFSSTKKKSESTVSLPQKTSPGPNSSIKEFPLLYLYFDDFDEIASAWEVGLFEAARDNTDTRSKKFSLNHIMQNEELFIELYKNDLLRLRLNERAEIRYEIGQLYWDDVIHPERTSSDTSSDEKSSLEQAETDKSVKAIVEKIKIRYDMDKTSIKEDTENMDTNDQLDENILN